MKKFNVNWGHRLGGRNTQIVFAKSEQAAIDIVRMQHGANDLDFVRVIKK
jgi:hypothetical protein